MALSKIQSAGISLSDNFAFTGTVSGDNGGAMEVISYSHTGASGASSIEVTLPTDTKYRFFKLVLSDWYGSAGADIHSRVRRTGQTSYDSGSSAYHWVCISAHHSNSTVNRRSGMNDGFARLGWYGHGNSSLESSTLELDIYESNSTSECYVLHKRWGADSSNVVNMDTGGYRHYVNSVIDRIKVYGASGTVNYSAYTLYGHLRE